MKKSILLFTILLSAQNIFSFGIPHFDLKSNIVSLYTSIKNRFRRESTDLKQFRVFSNITFDDVIGMEKTVQEAKQYIAKILTHSNQPAERYLCLGPTRTGKSHFVNSIIGSMHQLVTNLCLPNNTVIALDCCIGAGPKYENIFNTIRTILHEKPNQIFLIFTGEIAFFDCNIQQCQHIITNLLQQLQFIQKEFPLARIITFLMAAEENVTEEMKKSGNFTKTIQFDYPSAEHKKEFLHRQFEKYDINKKEFDFDKLTQHIESFPYAESYEAIEYLLHESMMQATIQTIPFSQEFFETFVEKQIARAKARIKIHQSS